MIRTTKTMCIRCGNAYYPYFNVSNDVLQCGICHQFIICRCFKILLYSFIALGDNWKTVFLFNHLCYAGDLCLISLSSAGMQKRLNVCLKYAIYHSITYNAKTFFYYDSYLAH